MANVLKIKGSQVTPTPAALTQWEMAYSEASNTLFIGMSDGSVLAIGGATFVNKLNGIEAGANNYIHPTVSGSKHIPSGGSTGQVLMWSADGVASWGSPPAAVSSVAGKTGAVTLVKADVGLGSVDNTADSAKNVLSATALTTARTIAGVSFNGSANITIPLANITKDSNNRTITDTQLGQLNTLYTWYTTMTGADADALVNTIGEVLSAFANAPEGLNVAAQLTTPTNMMLDGGSF